MGGPPAEAAFAETQPPGGGVISDEGSTHASGLQDLGASEKVGTVDAADASPCGEIEALAEVAPVAEGFAESTLISGHPEGDAGEPVSEPASAEADTSERLSLELEIEPEALPEPLRTALLDACDGGLTLPVTLRLRRS